MNRALKVDRLYNLGDYRNIHITDEITDLPEEYVTDSKVIELLRFMQLLETEKTFQKYLVLLKTHSAGKTAEESVGLLEQLQSDTMNELAKIIKNGNSEN